MQNILIIEDDKFLRDLISQKLKQDGFNILEAIDGEEGWRMVQEEPVDLILLDLVLPGMDGFEVLEKIKNDPKTKKTPVMIISNLGEEKDIKRGLELGVVDYIIKAHLTPTEVVDKIKKALVSKKPE